MSGFKLYDGEKPFGFISYSHQDKKYVFSVLAKLMSNRIRLWFDHFIFFGDDWRDEVTNHIKKCDTFIAFLTENSNVSKDVIIECGIAADHEKQILGIFVDFNKENLSGSLEYVFGGKHLCLDFNWNNKNSFDKLNQQLDIIRDSKAWNDIPNIPIFDDNGDKIGLASRNEIHKKPLRHKTSIVCVVMSDDRIFYMKRPKKSDVGGGKYGFFGGHMKENETYLETALRELSEELGLGTDVIHKDELILIGNEGKFEWNRKKGAVKNVEFSTFYLYFLNPKISVNLINAKETYGEDEPIFVEKHADYLNDLVEKFKKNSEMFADGITRVLSDSDAVKKIDKVIKNRDKVVN